MPFASIYRFSSMRSVLARKKCLRELAVMRALVVYVEEPARLDLIAQQVDLDLLDRLAVEAGRLSGIAANRP